MEEAVHVTTWFRSVTDNLGQSQSEDRGGKVSNFVSNFAVPNNKHMISSDLQGAIVKFFKRSRHHSADMSDTQYKLIIDIRDGKESRSYD